MKVSVVTVCYNAIGGIEKTISSVLGQSFPEMEYIVIDGGSQDGTVDVITQYADRINYFVSEPDGGIYDAMNKGVRVATGEWITFLNAGDTYFSPQSIEAVFSREIPSDVDVVYGYQVHGFSYGQFVRKQLPLSFFSEGMPFGHESSFVRAEVMKRHGFDTRYKIAADYHFSYQLHASGGHFMPVDAIVAVFEAAEGVSTAEKTVLLTHRESAMINGTYHTVRYKRQVISIYVRMLLKKCLSLFSKDFVIRQQFRKREQNEEYIPLNVFLSNRHA